MYQIKFDDAGVIIGLSTSSTLKQGYQEVSQEIYEKYYNELFNPSITVELNVLVDKNSLINSISQNCHDIISKGIDLQINEQTKHFSLDTADQTNIDSMFTAVTLGAKEYPYHADNEECTMFSAEQIVQLYLAYKTFVTKETTYHNMLKMWVTEENDQDILSSIYYGIELPEEYQTKYNELLAAAQAQIESIVSKMIQQGATE